MVETPLGGLSGNIYTSGGYYKKSIASQIGGMLAVRVYSSGISARVISIPYLPLPDNSARDYVDSLFPTTPISPRGTCHMRRNRPGISINADIALARITS